MAPRKTQTTTKASMVKELGASSSKNSQGFDWEEFIPNLRGRKAIKKYREMRDNDPIIGAIILAMDLMLRGVDWRVEGENDEAIEFVESVMGDMENTWEDFISDVVSFLPFGFSVFEIVYKRRRKTGTHKSRHDDGKIGVHKLSPRPQWTITEFVYEDSKVVGYKQDTIGMTGVTVPMSKSILFRTSSLNDLPTGRSILRNAYVSYYYSTHVTSIESIAIERELNGLPVARIPSEYLVDNASADKVAFRNAIEQMVRDVKRNEQGYIVLPSDLYTDDEGKLSSSRMVEFELMTSSGTRDIDTSKVIMRHQQDMARSVLADFITLGQGDTGSFALSKSKTDLFLSALQAYADNIAATITKQLITPLWRLNGFNDDDMPDVVAGTVAPADLGELGEFVRNVSGAGMPIFADIETENAVREMAGLPTRDDDDDLLGMPDPDMPPMPGAASQPTAPLQSDEPDDDEVVAE